MRSIVVFLAILALTLTGCQQAAQKALEQSTGVQVTQRGDSVTIKGKEGETVTYSSGLPDALRSFPIPQGFNLESGGGGSVATKSGEGMAVATWKGAGSVQSVSDYFKTAMVDQGWTEEVARDVGDMAQHSYFKGEDQAILVITKDENDIKIQVMLGKNAKK